MKAPLLIAALAVTLPLEARTFTSSDGSKKIEAELISYQPSTDTVVLRIKGRGSRTTSKASAFSEQDRAYFAEFHKEANEGRALAVTTEVETERFETGGGLYTYRKEKEFFRVTVVNRSESTLENLTAKYDIYVSRYDKEGKKVTDVVSGEASIASIAGGLDTVFDTYPVEVTIDCSTSSSCPKCATQAASVKRERLIGVRIRIYKESGKLLTEYYSSNSARSAAQKQEEEA